MASLALQLAVALTVIVTLTGCPSAHCPTTPHTDLEQALRYHRSMRSHARSLRAEARVDQFGRDGRIRGSVLMWIERPDRVRFDAMTQFGPAAVLTSDGASFALMDLRENRYSTGPTCPTNIARLLGIPMSGEEVARLLLGDTPTIAAESQAVQCASNGHYLLTLTAADGARQEIELSVPTADREAPLLGQHLRLRRSEVFTSSGDTLWRVTFSDYRVLRDPEGPTSPPMGVAMPFEVHFVHPHHGADTLLKFQEISLNRAPPEGAFAQRPPSGIEVEIVSCEQTAP